MTKDNLITGKGERRVQCMAIAALILVVILVTAVICVVVWRSDIDQYLHK